MADKYQRFWDANHAASDIVGQIAKRWGHWGGLRQDNADVILMVSKLEKIAPELLAVTWVNESSFTFYCEPNKNNSSDFNKWDVGPMQLNIGYTSEDIKVKFVSGNNISLSRAFGNPTDLFSGDPIENVRLGAQKLIALGRAAVIGKNKQELFPKVSVDWWKTLDEDTKNLRRAMLYTRPDARNWRGEIYLQLAPAFKKFFEVYGKA
jgi:hypothetical protein